MRPGEGGPARGHWRGTLAAAGALLGAYLLLLVPHWTPGGDSELFAAAARSIARGEGYSYNGHPVRLAPPGWPALLAAAFSITPTFLAGKLVNLACTVAAAAVAHRVLLRLVPPAWATLAVVAGGLAVPAYTLTMWLHSDPPFVLLAWVAALAACRLIESPTLGGFLGWTLALLAAAALMPTVRYLAAVQWGVPFAVLLAGVKVAPRRATVAMILGALVTLGLLAGTIALVDAAADGAEVPAARGGSDWEHELPNVLDNGPSRRPPVLIDRGLRLLSAGLAPAWLLCYPLRFASATTVGGIAVGAAGLVILALVIRGAMRDRRRRWVWAAVVAYVALLAVGWPNPNARYLVPIAPLLVAGAMTGLGGRRAIWFAAAVIALNVPMLLIDAAVARGGSQATYLERYESGRLASLVGVVDELHRRGVGDGEVAVSDRYDNLGRRRYPRSGTREVVLLLDRAVVTVPEDYAFEPGRIPPDYFEVGRVVPGGLAAWMRGRGLRYYLFQRGPRPWRLWHFDLPRWAHDLAGGPAGKAVGGWALFELTDSGLVEVDVPESNRAITRVPGL